jgi:hypothetical protein
LRRALTLLAHALVVWALCGATMAIALQVTSEERALVAHAVAAPVAAAIVSAVYYGAFGYTSPIATAAIVTGVVALLDLAVVALLVQGSLDMFRSVMGVWLPLGLIFVQTAVSGYVARFSERHRPRR